jgi:hypothetical protein
VKQILAALIVALAIVFHAVAPHVFRQAGGQEVEGWAIEDAMVCASIVTFVVYQQNQMKAEWEHLDDYHKQIELQQRGKRFALTYGECEELTYGQTVTWLPAAPLSLEHIPDNAEKVWREYGSLESIRRVVLIKYTGKDGIEKRGYVERLGLRSLDQAAEPSQ